MDTPGVELAGEERCTGPRCGSEQGDFDPLLVLTWWGARARNCASMARRRSDMRRSNCWYTGSSGAYAGMSRSISLTRGCCVIVAHSRTLRST